MHFPCTLPFNAHSFAVCSIISFSSSLSLLPLSLPLPFLVPHLLPSIPLPPPVPLPLLSSLSYGTRQKRMQQFVKICVPLFDKKTCLTFTVCARSTRIRNCGTFCQAHRYFCQTRCNSANAPYFHGKRRRNPWIARIAALGAAIKVWHFWWEKSGTHAAMFSSAAAARLLHSS